MFNVDDYYIDINLRRSPNYEKFGKKEGLKKSKKIGYWQDGEDLKQYIVEGWNETNEAKCVLRYIENSTGIEAYCGLATDRIDGCTMMGSLDMLTPDFKWNFPEKYDHYIKKYSLKPKDEEFIADAVKWCDMLDYLLAHAEEIVSSVVNKTLLERQYIRAYRRICNIPSVETDVKSTIERYQQFLSELSKLNDDDKLHRSYAQLYLEEKLEDPKKLLAHLLKYNYPILDQLRLPNRY